MPLILAAPKRAGKSSRGTPRLRKLQRHCMALRALLQAPAAEAEAKRLAHGWNCSQRANHAAVAAKGGILVYLDWPASSRPQPKSDLVVANRSRPFALVPPIAAPARP